MLRLSKKRITLDGDEASRLRSGRRAATAREIAERYDIPIELMAKC